MNLPRPNQHQKDLATSVLNDTIVLSGITSIAFGLAYLFLYHPIYLLYFIYGISGLVVLFLLWAAIIPIKKNNI